MAENRKTCIPDTYVIIFFVVLFAALLTWTIPVGQFETREVKYMMGATEKSRTVLIPDSFKYKLNAEGQPAKDGIPLFKPDEETGILNKIYKNVFDEGELAKNQVIANSATTASDGKIYK